MRQTRQHPLTASLQFSKMSSVLISEAAPATALYLINNSFYVSLANFEKITGKAYIHVPTGLPVALTWKDVAFAPAYLRADASVPADKILSSNSLRVAHSLVLHVPIAITPLNEAMVPNLATVTFEVRRQVAGAKKELSADAIIEYIITNLSGHFVKNTATLTAVFDGVVVTLYASGTLVDGWGRITPSTVITMTKKKDDATFTLAPSVKYGRQTTTPLLQAGFDFNNLGVGGLQDEMTEVFRRVFSSRLLPPALVTKMGLTHVRGMLLYGPPGCGKTLIARKLSQALRCSCEPKIVNGPELLNRYVGASEENVRELFADAETEEAERGVDSDLHVIILDEIDSLCRKRGSTSDSTGVNDKIVTQLLSKIDGVKSLNNILLIGLTNRREALDEALLRPGRMEVQVEIGLPNTAGRLQILSIHTKALAANKLLAADVDLNELAESTKSYTGAEIEGLVREARGFALQRVIDPKHLDRITDVKSILITMDDFRHAVATMRPMFGSMEPDFATQYFPHDICRTFPGYTDAINKGLKVVESVVGATAGIQLVMSIGEKVMSWTSDGHSEDVATRGCGATALAAWLARSTGFPYVRVVTPDHLLGLTDMQKIEYLNDVFVVGYKSGASAIVLDNVSDLVERISVGRFNASMVHALTVFLQKRAPPGHRQLVITTQLPDADLVSQRLFNVHLDLPSHVALRDVYHELGLCYKGRWHLTTDEMVEAVSEHARWPLKRVFAIFDMACALGAASGITKLSLEQAVTASTMF